MSFYSLHADQLENHSHVLAFEIAEDSHLIKDGHILDKNQNPDGYLEAYIKGVLDTKYPDSGILVGVRNGSIFLSNLKHGTEQSREIISFVKALTKRSVAYELETNDSEKRKSAETPQTSNGERPIGISSKGIWMPQSTILYPTEIANPRQICFSIGARFNDRLTGKWGTPVSFGDQLPIYRWTNIRNGDLQLELEAGVFALFSMVQKSYPLINADYYVGIPITYARDDWAFRLRGYHVSSHLGDEYIQHHKHVNRKNKSFEAIDFSAAYSISPKLRVYGTVGYIPFSDSEMHIKPLYIQYGAEVRGPRTDFTQLFGQPFFSIFFQNTQDVRFAMDATYAVGYEWGKIQGIGRKVRLFFEYHSGFSPEGQFSRMRSKHVAIRLSYGF
ncbi:MAG: DUF1207 domain-containing protein [Chlamydia sp.]